MTGPLKPCGTTAAYRRHLRAGEKPCDACRKAAYRAETSRRRPYAQAPELFRGKTPIVIDPAVPYRYRARRYAWAVRVLAASEAKYGRPDDEVAA